MRERGFAGNGPNLAWEAYIRFRPQFEEAMDPRFHSINYLDDIIAYGEAQFRSNETGAIVFELKTYPTGAKAVEGLIAAGKLEAIRMLIPQAEKWGREQGAIVARIESRSGWVRALKDDGYQLSQTALVKDL